MVLNGGHPVRSLAELGLMMRLCRGTVCVHNATGVHGKDGMPDDLLRMLPPEAPKPETLAWCGGRANGGS